MIKFRQKEYSSLGTKLLFKKNQIGNLGAKIRDAFLPASKEKTALSRVGVMRKTIGQKNKIKYAKNLVVTDPKQAARNTIATVVENPIATAGLAVPLPGTALVAKPVENALKKSVPAYSNVTKGAGSLIRKPLKTPPITVENSSPLVSRGKRFWRYNVPSAIEDAGKMLLGASAGVPVLSSIMVN